jgi:acetylornithine deacetylase/succinyl-diaminopimelate desuccinylase-like protein
MTHDPLSLTRQLSAFNTMNPPSNERECAQYWGCLFEAAGFDVRYFEFAHHRAYACRIISDLVRDSFGHSVYPLLLIDLFRTTEGVIYGKSNRVV